MPDVKVYVRSEDLDKWNAIEKKSGWLHLALNLKLRSPTKKEIEQIKSDPFSKGSTLSETVVEELDIDGNVVPMSRAPYVFCKHGADPQFCKFAKPGKPCK